MAILVWGDVFHDFLDRLGVSLDQFCDEFTGSWVFGNAAALKTAGAQTLIICPTTKARTPVARIHAPTGARLLLLLSGRVFGAIRPACARQPARWPTRPNDDRACRRRPCCSVSLYPASRTRACASQCLLRRPAQLTACRCAFGWSRLGAAAQDRTISTRRQSTSSALPIEVTLLLPSGDETTRQPDRRRRVGCSGRWLFGNAGSPVALRAKSRQEDRRL